MSVDHKHIVKEFLKYTVNCTNSKGMPRSQMAWNYHMENVRGDLSYRIFSVGALL